MKLPSIFEIFEIFCRILQKIENFGNSVGLDTSNFSSQRQFMEAAMPQSTFIYGAGSPAMGVAATYSGLKEYDKAERHYEIAILLKRPAVDDEYMQLALLYGAQKQYGKQYKALQRVVAENPESQRGWYMLATAVENQQADASKAIPHYEKYLEKFGENALYSEYAKQRIKDITTQLHFEKD